MVNTFNRRDPIASMIVELKYAQAFLPQKKKKLTMFEVYDAGSF